VDPTRLPFWSGEALLERLPSLIIPFAEERIDCAAYTLAMGREIYVSPNDQTVDPSSVSIRKLDEGEAFTIPAGQFAFLLTEEIISVPPDAIGFISMKAKIKWRGLVNVSGFHVDPGFRGRLIFAVFNAGPVPVHLRQGQPAFLIWYAGLDRKSERVKKGPAQESIPPELISGIAGELQSFAGLSKKIRDVEKTLADKVHRIEREQTYYRVIGAIALGLFITIVTSWVKDGGASRLLSPPPAVTTMPGSSPATQTAPKP
jgi:dCTP deaminase